MYLLTVYMPIKLFKNSDLLFKNKNEILFYKNNNYSIVLIFILHCKF